MNVWALNKSQDLKALLLLFQQRVPHFRWTILEANNHDFNSIRLGSQAISGLTAYVSQNGQLQGCFGLHLEYPAFTDSTALNNAIVVEDIEPARALELLIGHLAD